MPVAVGISLVWFFALGALGLIFPYVSLYLRENAGLTGTQVGVVMAVLPFVGTLAQPLWGHTADRRGARRLVLTIVCTGAAVGHLALVLPRSFAGFVAVVALLSLFATSVIPAAVSLTLALLGAAGHQAFGRARAWGTLGYAVTVGLLPVLLHILPPTPFAPGPASPAANLGLGWIFPGAAGLFGAAALLTLLLPADSRADVRAERGEWRLLLRDGAFVRLLATTFLAYLCLQGPTALFPLLVAGHGGGVEAISRMWLLMLLLELPLVWTLGRAVARLGPRGVIGIGLVAAAVRWTVSGFTADMGILTAAQVLHGVTVWGVTLGAPLYADLVVPTRLRSTAQGVLAMGGTGLGSIASTVLAGWLIDAYGPTAPARAAGVATLVLAVSLVWLLPPARTHA